MEERRFFDRIATSCEFPSLKKLTLKGIFTTDEAILSLLRSVHLHSLQMEWIVLQPGGKFRPIFDHLKQSMPTLEYLHLDNLFEEGSILHFDVPGEKHFEGAVNYNVNGPNVIVRTGISARAV